MFNLMDSLNHSLGRNFMEALQIILSVTAVAAIACGIIQWSILSVKDWSTSIRFSIFITSVITGIFFLFILYAANYGRDKFVFFPVIGYTLLMFFVCFSGMLFINYGIKMLIQHNSGGGYKKTHAAVWRTVAVAPPLLYFLYSTSQTLITYVSKISTATALVNVAHDSDLPLYITEIKFINSKNNTESAIKIKDEDVKAVRIYDNDKYDLEDENAKLNHDVFSKISEFPVESDKLLLTWYSFAEKKYYRGTYLINYANFNYKKKSFKFLGHPKLQPIYIKLKLGGKMNLLTYDNWQTYLLNEYPAANDIAISEEEINLLTNRYFSENKQGSNPVIKDLKLLEEKAERQGKLFNWGLKFEWLNKKTTGIFITDLNQTEFSLLDGSGVDFSLKVLPTEIDLRDSFNEQQYAHINLFLNTEKLFEIMEESDTNEPVTFTVKVGDVLKNEVQFLIKTRWREVEMPHVQKEIKIYDR